MTANHIVAISETAGFFSTLNELEKTIKSSNAYLTKFGDD